MSPGSYLCAPTLSRQAISNNIDFYPPKNPGLFEKRGSLAFKSTLTEGKEWKARQGKVCVRQDKVEEGKARKSNEKSAGQSKESVKRVRKYRWDIGEQGNECEAEEWWERQGKDA